MTPDDWQEEFAKYRASPEFQRVNSRMTLDEFKFIYWMEYAHRMWGRALGVVFAVPALYFAAGGHIRGALSGRLGLLFLMGGAQVCPPLRIHRIPATWLRCSTLDQRTSKLKPSCVASELCFKRAHRVTCFKRAHRHVEATHQL